MLQFLKRLLSVIAAIMLVLFNVALWTLMLWLHFTMQGPHDTPRLYFFLAIMTWQALNTADWVLYLVWARSLYPEKWRRHKQENPVSAGEHALAAIIFIACMTYLFTRP